MDECGAPMVSNPGGEPLMHPQIKEIVECLVARKKYIYLCTNALLLEEKIGQFTPSKYLENDDFCGNLDNWVALV